MDSRKVRAVAISNAYKQRAAQRSDDFMNLVTSLGDPNRDKRMMTSVTSAKRLTQAQLEEWYAGDAIFAKVVDLAPDDMVREGVDLNLGNPKADKVMLEFLRDLDWLGQVAWAKKMARLHGGAVVLIGANDGLSPEQPLNMDSILSLDYLTVLDRWSIYPAKLYEDPLAPKYGKPMTYTINPVGGQRGAAGRQYGTEIHESRLIRFEGVRLPDRLLARNQGWGDPVGNRLYNAIRNWHVSHDSAATIVHDFTQGVYTFTGLVELLSQGEEGIAAVKQRLTELDMSKSVVRALVLDEGESYQKLSTAVNGLKDLIDAASQRLTAESDMPHTRLLGESPGASLGEGGQAQDRQWYDHVASMQENELRMPLERIVSVALAAKKGPTAGAPPTEWTLEFNPLWQLTAKEQAEIEALQADTDKKYVDMGTYAPAEVRDSRWANGKWQPGMTLDDAAWEALDEPADEGEDLGPDAAAPGGGRKPPQEGEPAE